MMHEIISELDPMHMAYCKFVLTSDDGRRFEIGKEDRIPYHQAIALAYDYLRNPYITPIECHGNRRTIMKVKCCQSGNHP